MLRGRTGSLLRTLAVLALAAVMVASLRQLDHSPELAARQDRLYFPSGRFLIESSLGFREAAADYLWFRFIQYYGAFAKDQNDFRYFDLLIDGITRLDPRFVEAYYFASLVKWSDFGDIDASLDILRRGLLHNPDTAKLPFQIGFIYYVFHRDFPRAAFWFETAGKCSDASDKERRFAAFARYRSGDDRVSLELWKMLLNSTDSPQMRELAETMIGKIERLIARRAEYGDAFIGPIPVD